MKIRFYLKKTVVNKSGESPQYRDQIWFAEKGKPHEATVLKRLSEIEMSDEGEFRKVRRDRIFEKDYFDKKYGAPPDSTAPSRFTS